VANNDGSKTSTTDIEKLRLSDRQIDNNLRDAASTVASTTKDKDGTERFWGFKVSKTAAFAINSLYDNVILPFTREGSKQIYNGVLQIAEKSEHTSGRAHAIASGVALAARIAAVVAKPTAEFISINREHYGERAELYDKVSTAIVGTPADYSNNEVIKTAFDKVHDQWSRDVIRKVPDLIKVGIQSGMPYSEHQLDMAKKPGAIKAAAAAATGSTDPKLPVVDTAKEDLHKRVKQMKTDGVDQSLIDMEVEEFKRTRGMGPKEEDKQFGVLTPNLSGALGFSAEIAKVAVDEYTAGTGAKKDNAWERIQLLKAYMNEQPAGQDPSRIRVNGVPLKKFIVEIFQQNEIDRGRGRMGEALVDQLMPAVDKIADQIANTTLDANALVHLVGDHKIILHEGAARIFANAEKVDEAIASVRGVNTSKERVNIQEFFSNFADPALARDVVKKNVETLQGPEKAVFASIFPDELLTQAGLSKDAITALRKEAHDSMYDVVAANTIELAQVAPDQLRELGLNKAEIAAIQELGKEIKHGDIEAVKTAVDGADRTVISAIRTAALHQQVANKEEGAKVWTSMVQKGASIHEKIENGALKQEEKPKSFAERERKHDHPKGEHAAHQKTSPNMSASEKELHRRTHGAEPHEGIGVW